MTQIYAFISHKRHKLVLKDDKGEQKLAARSYLKRSQVRGRNGKSSPADKDRTAQSLVRKKKK